MGTKDAGDAAAWLRAVKAAGRASEERDEIEKLAAAWPGDLEIARLACVALCEIVDGRAADETIGADDPARAAAAVARRALAAVDDLAGADPRRLGPLFAAYGNALRLCGPDNDSQAIAAFDSAMALTGDPALAFDRALLHKQRGQWRDALTWFDRYLAGDPDDEAALNNVGICATALGMGERAADAWRALGFDGVSVGDDGLARVANLPPVKLRLPVAGDPDQSRPGFEHVWVRSLSPCHGEILNPPIYPVPAGYSDIVLYDRAAVGWAELDGRRVPRVPLLLLLWRGDAEVFELACDPTDVDAVEAALPEGASIYRWDTQIHFMCRACLEDPGHAGDHDPAPSEAPPVIRGCLVLEPGTKPAAAAEALADHPELRVAVPDLWRAAGDEMAARRADRLRRELLGVIPIR